MNKTTHKLEESLNRESQNNIFMNKKTYALFVVAILIIMALFVYYLKFDIGFVIFGFGIALILIFFGKQIRKRL